MKHLWINNLFFLYYLSPTLIMSQASVLYSFPRVPTQAFEKARVLFLLNCFAYVFQSAWFCCGTRNKLSFRQKMKKNSSCKYCKYHSE